MPRAQYTNQFRKESVTATFPTPKRMSEIKYWLKAAQVAIKQIPRVIAESEASADRSTFSDGWFVANTDVDSKWIKFNLENRISERATIVIERKFQNMGG